MLHCLSVVGRCLGVCGVLWQYVSLAIRLACTHGWTRARFLAVTIPGILLFPSLTLWAWFLPLAISVAIGLVISLAFLVWVLQVPAGSKVRSPACRSTDESAQIQE